MSIQEKAREWTRKAGFTDTEAKVLLLFSALIFSGLAYSYFSRPAPVQTGFNYSREDSLYQALINGSASAKPNLNAQGSRLEKKNPPAIMSAININTASASELDELPGIGQVLAQRIIAYRQKNGNFRSAEDIMNVSGIGEGKYAKIRDRITIK